MEENVWGWNFPLGVSAVTGKIKLTDLKEDIRQSILILLSTVKGERLLHPEYGCNLNRFLFEPVSYDLIKAIKAEVLSSILEWEKRIYHTDVSILNDVNDDNRLIISITYMIPTLREVDTIQYIYHLNQ